MTAHIRKGIKADLPVVLDLIKELAEYEKALSEVTITLRELEEDGFGEHPWYWFIVAEVDGEIVGMSFYFIRYSTWKGPVIHLEDLMVDEAYRSKGVGKALYQAVLRYANERKVRRVNWEVLDWNSPAIEFYEKSGAQILKEWRVVSMSDYALNKYLNR